MSGRVDVSGRVCGEEKEERKGVLTEDFGRYGRIFK